MRNSQNSKLKTSDLWKFSAHWKALTHAPTSHLKPIDGLRALSILLLFAFHLLWCAQTVIRNTYAQYTELPGWIQWLKSGALGVEAFFVISGFLIGRLLIQEYDQTDTLNFKRFYARRFFRLMPAYGLAIASAALGALIYKGPEKIFERPISTNVENLWANLLYVNNFLPAKEQFLSHTWSLAVEEQFYFIAPLALLFLLRRRIERHLTSLLLTAVVSYFAIRAYFLWEALTVMQSQCGSSPTILLPAMLEANLQIFVSPLHDCVSAIEFDILYDNLYTRFIGFIFGIAAASLHLRHPEVLQAWFSSSKLHGPLMVLATLALVFPFLNQFVLSDPSARIVASRFLAHPLLDAGLCYWILSLIHGSDSVARFIAQILSSRPLYIIAQLSYSMYLFHILVIMGVYQALVGLLPDLELFNLIFLGGVLSFTLTLVVSLGVYVFVERPGIALRRFLPF